MLQKTNRFLYEANIHGINQKRTAKPGICLRSWGMIPWSIQDFEEDQLPVATTAGLVCLPSFTSAFAIKNPHLAHVIFLNF